MKKHITDEKNGLDYTLVNGVYLPNLISTETHYEIGQWGQRHLTYIRQNKKCCITRYLRAANLIVICTRQMLEQPRCMTAL